MNHNKLILQFVYRYIKNMINGHTEVNELAGFYTT